MHVAETQGSFPWLSFVKMTIIVAIAVALAWLAFWPFSSKKYIELLTEKWIISFLFPACYGLVYATYNRKNRFILNELTDQKETLRYIEEWMRGRGYKPLADGPATTYRRAGKIAHWCNQHLFDVKFSTTETPEGIILQGNASVLSYLISNLKAVEQTKNPDALQQRTDNL